MPNQQTNSKPQKAPQSLQERLAEKSVKTMEKAVEQQTMNRLQQGQSPDEILNSLLQFSKTPVAPDKPTFDNITGILPALGNKLRGGEFNPMEQRKQPLGLDKAIQIMNLNTNMMGEQRRQAKDERNIPLEQTNLVNALLKTVQQTQNPELASMLGVEPDFALKRIGQEVQIREQTQARSKQNVARDMFRKDLNEYLALDSFLQRGTSLPSNLKSGIQTNIKQFGGTTEGAAIATRKGIVNRMVPQLARLSSEVGNLNMFEQLAQRELIPSEFESGKTAQLKNAYLKQLSKAVESNDASEVKSVINKFVESEAYDRKKNNVFKSFDELRKSNLKPGTQIFFKDKSGRYRKAIWKGKSDGQS